ncbi:MAG: trypsin-like peptidase domain-containing protein [Caulobacter sp.]
MRKLVGAAVMSVVMSLGGVSGGVAQGSAGAAAGCRPNLAEVQRSVVRVVATNAKGGVLGWGTGFVIEGRNSERADNAVVVTSYHVLARATYVDIIRSGESERIRVRMLTSQRETSLDHDVAFIEVDGFEAPPLKLNRKPPVLSEPVFALGYTAAADNRTTGDLATTASAPSGTVTRLFDGPMFKGLSQTPVSQVQHNADLEPGFSGGPLVDCAGAVVGLNVADGGHVPLPGGYGIDLSRGTGFALATEELVAEANRHGVKFVTQVSQTSGPVAVSGAGTGSEAAKPPEAPEGGLIESLRANPVLLIALVLAALALVGAGVWILRPQASGSGETRIKGETQVLPSAAAPPPPPPAPVLQPILVLTGRGPTGEALQFTFTVDDVQGGAAIGSDRSKVRAAIDDRKDYAVSRVHALIDFDGQGFTIEDNKSANGTKVGGAKIEAHKPQRLVDGDELELADVRLRVSVQG